MKLKDIEGLLEGYDPRWNNALSEIGEKELEIDAERVRNELTRIMLAGGYREQDGWEIETLAQAIAKADIIRVKK